MHGHEDVTGTRSELKGCSMYALMRRVNGMLTCVRSCVGGWVCVCMFARSMRVSIRRVNGTLAVARAMGDFSFKREKKMSAEEQQVTCNPEIRKFTLDGNDEFIILACDGIWDVLTSQEAIDLVAGKMKEGKGLKEILSTLFDHCLSPHPSANEVRLSNLHFCHLDLLYIYPPAATPSTYTARPSVFVTTFSRNLTRSVCAFVCVCACVCICDEQGLGCDNMTAVIVKFKR